MSPGCSSLEEAPAGTKAARHRQEKAERSGRGEVQGYRRGPAVLEAVARRARMIEAHRG